MSTQSTKYIDRETAIGRIKQICNLLADKNYREIETQTFETEENLPEFVDGWVPIDVDNIGSWTDDMLSSYLDRPFFRNSIFDNYIISGDPQ